MSEKRMNTRTLQSGARAVASPGRTNSFRIDDAYVVLVSPHDVERLASVVNDWAGHRLTLVIAAGQDDACRVIDTVGARAAVHRILLCEPDDAVPARRTAGPMLENLLNGVNPKCQMIAGGSRALRHCIDAMSEGDIIVYCADDLGEALGIIADYAAAPAGRIAAPPKAPNARAPHVLHAAARRMA
jgi:hypothetical protein